VRVFPYAVKVRWGGLRPEKYKPNAVDADWDGIIQEGTIWERPAGARMLDRLGKEIASGIDPPSSDPFDFSARQGMRIVDADGKDLDYTPTWEGEGLVPDVTGPAGPPVGGTPRSIADRGGRTVGDHHPGLGVGPQAEARAQREAADLAEAQAQAAAGVDRRGKPISHDPYEPPTDEAREIGREGIAAARETLAERADPELTGGVPDPAVEGTAEEDIVWDEAGRKWADLAREEKEFLIAWAVLSKVDTDLVEVEKLENDGKLEDPVEGESRNVEDIREKYPRLQKLRTKLAISKRLGYTPNRTKDIPDDVSNPVAMLDHPSPNMPDKEPFPRAPSPAAREKGRAYDFFSKMLYLARTLWGAENQTAAEDLLRDGIDDPDLGRRFVFTGKEPDLSGDAGEGLNELNKTVLGGDALGDYLDGTFLPSESAGPARDQATGTMEGAKVLGPDLDRTFEEMISDLDLDNPNADLPVELYYLALEKKMEEAGSEKAQEELALETAEAIQEVGGAIAAEVRARFNAGKRAAETAGKATNFLTEWLSRTLQERIDQGSVEAREMDEFGRKELNFSADHFDFLHVDHPEIAETLNEAARRTIEELLGYVPSWATRERVDPVDPRATVEQQVARIRTDAPGGAPDWETAQAVWNGNPEYLFTGLIQELSDQFRAGEISEREFVERLEGLVDEVVPIFHEKLGEVMGERRTGFSGMTMSNLRGLASLFFSSSDSDDKRIKPKPEKEGTDLYDLLARMGMRRRSSIDVATRTEGMDEPTLRVVLAGLGAKDVESLDNENLRRLLEELEFRLLWSGDLDPANSREAFTYLQRDAGAVGEAKAFKESSLIRATWFEVGFRAAMADATRMEGADGDTGVIEELHADGLLESIAIHPTENQTLLRFMKELLLHGDSDGVRAALMDGRSDRRDQLNQLLVKAREGQLTARETRTLKMLQRKTAGELDGPFDHDQIVLERSGEEVVDAIQGIVTLLNEIDTIAAVRSTRPSMDPESDALLIRNELLGRLEKLVEDSFAHVPLRMLRRLGLLGPLGIQVEQFLSDGKGGIAVSDVTRAAQRHAVPIDGGYQVSKTYGGMVLHLPATSDLPTVGHEGAHALATAYPEINDLLMALVSLVTGTEEDGLRGWNGLVKPMSSVSPARTRGISGSSTSEPEFFVDIPGGGDDSFVYPFRVYLDFTDPNLREHIDQLVTDGQIDLEKVAQFRDEYEKHDRGFIRLVPSELISVVMESLTTPDAYQLLDMWGSSNPVDVKLAEFIFGLILTVG